MKALSRRQAVLAALTLLLLAVNVAHWWPRGAEGPRMERHPAADGFRPEDFLVRAQPLIEESDGGARRDLFRPKSALAVAKGSQPPAPVKTPQQLEEEAARAELAQIKLVGVVVRGDKPQAFLTSGTQTYLVHAGDPVGSRFRVEDIGTDNIRLKDAKTNVSGQIPISGK